VVASIACCGATAAYAESTAGAIRIRVGFQEGTCAGALVDELVVLEPLGIEAITDADGIVEFTGVDPGTYVVHLAAPCRSGSCWDDVEVTLGQADLFVDLCAPVCGTQVFVSPERGEPGTTVTVEGACQSIHSGGRVDFHLGPIAVASGIGMTGGDYVQTFTVPFVPNGLYTVQAAGGGGALAASGAFEVIGDHAVCAGDCDGDQVVEIAELIRSVGIALGTVGGSSCPVFDDGAEISDLVRAVRAALDGCSPSSLAIPTATPVIDEALCRDCCAGCTDAECVSQCVGRDSCLLLAEVSGVVRDAATGQPIAGAVVTLNGAMVVSAADGTYAIRSQREEICSGLDYLFELTTRASGYATFSEQLYRVPFASPAQRTIELAPIPENPPPSALAMGGVLSLRAGKVY
jgi:hypothetical protein